jgi:membrane associated rhomboid family serine protease
MFSQPLSGVVRHLVIINVLMYFGTLIIMGEPRGESLGRLYLAAFMPGSPYMFMHGDIGHLAFNMLSLYFFGPMVEMVWGHKRFLFYYLFCGVGAYFLHMGFQFYEMMESPMAGIGGPMLGASGAVFGIFVAFAYLFPNQVISLILPPISIKAKYFVPIMAALEFFYGVHRSASGIAHFAHLGGAVFGFLLILIWYRGRVR